MLKRKKSSENPLASMKKTKIKREKKKKKAIVQQTPNSTNTIRTWAHTVRTTQQNNKKKIGKMLKERAKKKC